jgi:hypothetical protein
VKQQFASILEEHVFSIVNVENKIVFLGVLSYMSLKSGLSWSASNID